MVSSQSNLSGKGDPDSRRRAEIFSATLLQVYFPYLAFTGASDISEHRAGESTVEGYIGNPGIKSTDSTSGLTGKSTVGLLAGAVARHDTGTCLKCPINDDLTFSAISLLKVSRLCDKLYL